MAALLEVADLQRRLRPDAGAARHRLRGRGRRHHDPARRQRRRQDDDAARALRHGAGPQGEIRFGGSRIDGKATEDIVRLRHRPRARRPRHLRRPDRRGEPAPGRLRAHATSAEVRADLERVYGYFPRLKERRQQQAGTLSGGEQQMLAVSRALMLRPRLLLLDEPSFGLAPLVVQEMFGILRAINQQREGQHAAGRAERGAGAATWPTTPTCWRPAAS